MKTIYNKIAAIVLLIVALNACSDDFLDNPKRGLTPADEFYRTPAEAMMGNVAIYDALQIMYAAPWHSPWMLRTLMSDEVRCGSSPSDQPDLTNLNAYTHGPSNGKILDAFRWCYVGILRSNKVIHGCSPEDDALKSYVAEALFMRAYFHFELVSMWGKVPVVTQELVTPSELQAPSKEVSEVYAQIEADLKAAITDLPNKSQYSAADKYRASKEAAIALLGKAYLYQKKYAEAATEFEKIIGRDLSLGNDYSVVLKEGSEFGDESLFEISYARGATTAFDWGDHKRNENNVTWQLCGAALADEANTLGINGGWTFCPPRRTFYDSYEAADSVRLAASMIDSTDFAIKYKGSAKAWSNDPENDGVIRLRYGSWKSETDTTLDPAYNRGTNIRLIRYADVLLMAAEANALKTSPDEAKALGYLNQVRGRTGLNLTPRSSAGSQLLADIKYERKVELAFEGHRWLDLVRWGDAQAVLGALDDGRYSAKHDKFPLPLIEVEANPNMPQNPLWE